MFKLFWIFIFPIILSDFGRDCFGSKSRKGLPNIVKSFLQPEWYFVFLYKWSYWRWIFLLALNNSVLTLKEFSRYQFLLVRAEKSNVFPVHVLPYFMIWLNCCKYFLWPFYCWNMMAIELFLNSISSKYQKLAVGWADVEFCKIADHIKKVYIL